MRAARGTHGSHSIRLYPSSLADETCSNPLGPNGAGWLACQVRYPPIAALWLTGHVLVAVTETRAVANIKTNLTNIPLFDMKCYGSIKIRNSAVNVVLHIR